MPFMRPRLTNAERAARLARAEELRDAGLDIDIPQGWREKLDLLDITLIEPPVSEAFDTPTGGIYYAIYVRLVARQSGLILLHCDLTTDWDSGIELQSFDGRGLVYRLGRREYQPREVLNGYFDSCLRFHRRGHLVQGWILASGVVPFPRVYTSGANVPFQLTFTDQFESEISQEGQMYLNLTAKRNRKVVARHRGLYGIGETAESNKETSMSQPPSAIAPSPQVRAEDTEWSRSRKVLSTESTVRISRDK